MMFFFQQAVPQWIGNSTSKKSQVEESQVNAFCESAERWRSLQATLSQTRPPRIEHKILGAVVRTTPVCSNEPAKIPRPFDPNTDGSEAVEPPRNSARSFGGVV